MNARFHHAVARIVALHEKGASREALAAVNRLLRDNPSVPGLYNIRGGIQATRDALREAFTDRRRALLLKPDFHQALHNLGIGFEHQGASDQALAQYHRAVLVSPGFAPAHNNRGCVLRDLGRRRDALESFTAATRGDPIHAEGYLNLANSHRDLSDYGAARRAYRGALAARPEHGEAWHHLGIASQESTDNQSAAAFHRRALAIRPDHAECHRNLANLREYTSGHPHLSVMRDLLADPAAADDDRARLNFALAKAHDDFGDTDRSFAYLRDGNAARKAVLGYDIAQHEVLFERIRRAFATPIDHLVPGGGNAVRPIFILGMPRSGTTLIEQILAGHPEVHGAGELEDLSRLAYRYLPLNAASVPSEYSRDDLATLRDAYLAEITRRAASRKVVTDKMPTNFLWIGIIHAVFPRARIINLRRDPRAVAWSIYRHYFPTRAHGYAYDLADIARFHALYGDLMAFWSARAAQSHYELDYEAFTEDPEAGTRALLAYCGLDWSDRCLDFHRANRPVRTASAAQVRRPVYRGSSEAWRRYASHIRATLDGPDLLGFSDAE
jgi:tetratricopeptide (TPR) repeat protein